LIGRDEFNLPRPGIDGEILGVDLPTGARGRDRVQRHTSDRDDPDGLCAVGNQRCLDHLVRAAVPPPRW
jgi:hypothetical protein